MAQASQLPFIYTLEMRGNNQGNPQLRERGPERTQIIIFGSITKVYKQRQECADEISICYVGLQGQAQLERMG